MRNAPRRPMTALATAVATTALVLGASAVGFAGPATADPAPDSISSTTPITAFASPPAAPAGGALSATILSADRYIIGFTPGTSPTVTAATHAARSMAVETVLTNVFPGEVASLTASQVHALRLDPRVDRLEPDAVVTVDGSVTTQANAPWGLDRIDQQHLPLSGTYSYDHTGRGVKAYTMSI